MSSAAAWQHKLEELELWLYGYKARALVEAACWTIIFLNDDLERVCPFGGRVPLRVGQQTVTDAPPLVARRYERLLDHDRVAFRMAQGDEAREWPRSRATKTQIAAHGIEHPLVAPAGQAGKRTAREHKQLR
jgi:hypothetical protein